MLHNTNLTTNQVIFVYRIPTHTYAHLPKVTMEVYHPNDTFHFDHLYLSPPNSIPGGSYLTKYVYYDSKKPLYIQTPKTQSKQGVVVSGKKAHIDLLFTGGNDSDSEFIEWIADLEKRSVELLYEKRHLWFTQELDRSDIENSFTSPIRAFKTGNYLVRVNLELNRVQPHLQPFLCKVFDENRAIVPVDYVNAHHNIISIIEFQGIKFTARSFQMELILRQVLVIPELPLFETCVINTNTANTANTASEPLGKYAEISVDIENTNDATAAAAAAETTMATTTTAKELIETLDKSLGPTESNSSSSTLKHFECTEVDIDFKNIPDTIDTEEPTFDVPPQLSTPSTSTTTTTTTTTQKWKPNNSSSGNGGNGGNGGGGSLTLKKHKDVIYEMYKVAKRKAQEAKKAAIRAYLEAKEIKASYLLDDLESASSESDED